MNKLRSKQIFCHHNYKVWANIYGDMRNDLKAKTVLYCPKCGKRKYIKEYIEAPIDYNMFFAYMHTYNSKNPTTRHFAENIIRPSIIKNRDLFNKTFGEEYEFKF